MGQWRKLFPVILFLTALAALAADIETGPGTELPALVFHIRGHRISFVDFNQPPMLVSKSCLAGKGRLRCAATEAWSEASLNGVAPVRGGVNPGALVCEKVKGTVVIGQNRSGAENSFCLFEDGSLISNGSLHAKAVKRKGER